MSLIRISTVCAILGIALIGIAVIHAQTQTPFEPPQFQSGASVMMGVPIDFDSLNQRVGAIYEVVESNDSHIVWKFTGTTGDWAYVFADGRIVVASAVDFNLDAKDTLFSELNDVMDMLNSVFAGIISTEARNNALNSAVYYANEPEIYHRLKHNFNGNIDLTLFVPDCEVEKARMGVTGRDTSEIHSGIHGQHYYIDDILTLECEWDCTGICLEDPWCTAGSQDITDKILPGLHKITGNSHSQHTLVLEIITTSKPNKEFVLYGTNYIPWINETGKSLTLDDMNLLIVGTSTNNTTSAAQFKAPFFS